MTKKLGLSFAIVCILFTVACNKSTTGDLVSILPTPTPAQTGDTPSGSVTIPNSIADKVFVRGQVVKLKNGYVMQGYFGSAESKSSSGISITGGTTRE